MKNLNYHRILTLTAFLGIFVLFSSQESACSCENLGEEEEECFSCFADEPGPGQERPQQYVCGAGADEDWIDYAETELQLNNAYCIPD